MDSFIYITEEQSIAPNPLHSLLQEESWEFVENTRFNTVTTSETESINIVRPGVSYASVVSNKEGENHITRKSNLNHSSISTSKSKKIESPPTPPLDHYKSDGSEWLNSKQGSKNSRRGRFSAPKRASHVNRGKNKRNAVRNG